MRKLVWRSLLSPVNGGKGLCELLRTSRGSPPFPLSGPRGHTDVTAGWMLTGFPPCRTISHPSLLSVCILSYAEVQHVLFLFSVALHLVLPAIFFLSLILLVPNRAGERSRLSHLSIFVSFLSASKFTSSLLENKEPRASFHSNSGCWFNFILKRKSLCKWTYRWINRGVFFSLEVYCNL